MDSIDTILDKLESVYDAAVARLRADVIAFGRDRTIPAPERRSDGSYTYPELRLRYRGGEQPEGRRRAFGRLNAAGLYTTTVTRPALFRDYLAEQLTLISSNYEIEVEVGSSRQEIPFPYVLDGAAGAELAGVDPNEIARHFPSTDLSASRAWRIIPAPIRSISSVSSCSPTITAMSMNSSTGRASSLAAMAVPRWRVRAACC